MPEDSDIRSGERLQKVLARAGVASRRHAETLIVGGRVTVNDRIVAELGSRVRPEDSIAVDGRPVQREAERVWLAMHKPPMVIATVRDPRGRTTVVDLLPPGLPPLYPVGRLDWDSEGLILLTNDGELAHRVMHPRYGVPREYHVLLRSALDPSDVTSLEAGVPLDDGPSAPVLVYPLRTTAHGHWLSISMREGRNRQIRRMFAALGREVLRLVRVRHGPIDLDDLPPGATRGLSQAEVTFLLRSTGLRSAATTASPSRRNSATVSSRRSRETRP